MAEAADDDDTGAILADLKSELSSMAYGQLLDVAINMGYDTGYVQEMNDLLISSFGELAGSIVEVRDRIAKSIGREMPSGLVAIDGEKCTHRGIDEEAVLAKYKILAKHPCSVNEVDVITRILYDALNLFHDRDTCCGCDSMHVQAQALHDIDVLYKLRCGDGEEAPE